MSLLEVRNGQKQNELILNTPNRAEILKAGPPQSSKCNVLGKGAYGTVFKAIFRDKQVAVKVMKNANAINLQAIKNEAHVLGWHHRNIVKIMKVESTPNFGIVIMERFSGQSLKDVLDKTELTLPHRINVALDILSALSYCHRRKLLHLDVKPQNVYVTFIKGDEQPSLQPEGTSRQYICKLCDFGSSLRLIEQNHENYCTKGTVRGTIRYMSPEMIRGVTLTSSSDIYSLGIMMWHMQTRQIPYYWIECNDVVAYQVTKHNLRPDDVANFDVQQQHEYVSQIYKNGYKQLSSQSFAPANAQQEFELIKKRWPLKEVDVTIFPQTFRSIETLNDDFNFVSNVFVSSSNKIISTVDNETAYAAIYQCCWLSEPTARPNSQDLYKTLKRLL